MNRILVTGLHGFTGRYIKIALEENGYEVIGLKSNLTHKDELIKEIEKMQPEGVIHLAAIAFVGHENINAFYEVNLIGTRNLLEALSLKAPNIKSILLASSANVYGNQTEGLLNESTAPNPANDYAVSKFAMEKMACLWKDKLPIFIVRPFNYTGVGQNPSYVIPKIVSHFIQKREFIELGNIDVSREFNDVRMVAKLYVKLLELMPLNKAINICSGRAYSLQDILSLCEKISEHRLRVEINPAYVRKNEVRFLAGDNSLLNTIVGAWQAPNIENTLEWMLAHYT
ncbi:NAD-dependent epimerase/dehydratase family protein [Legionella longbeachae]|uniref:NAD-dependent epimerase/dehydratase family protein n=1 Tax=Legionella longbeachae TaxID=450 RepID=UPI0001BEC255|nr:NAD-dependent epimerase/dehydratase family protein [Legionella longbeachae]EEZ96991.1 NAD-dependent epimerase/dehydratase family protein [Legionella longbeachae D-4968]UAK46998.1 NAD-dependent epimerase/dehydratase family protein [Legionella longbeachae]VEE04044.1 GDP-D-mannose dehydratase, NAD(P)-binding [Legionella oakridgensis]